MPTEPANALEFRRYDAGELGRARETPQGGMRIPATVTRSGIFAYRDGARTRREYHPPEVVEASAATLAQAPVTEGHPGMVTAENFSRHVKGQVSDVVRFDATTGRLEAEVVVQDRRVVDAIRARRLTELSSGYHVRVDATPGRTPAGEDYDVKVTQIVHNHVALGPPGWARAGREASLRLDGEGHERAPEARRSRMEITLQGERFDLESEADVKACQKACDKLVARADAEAAAAVAARSATDAQTARADAASKDLAATRARLDGIELQAEVERARRVAPAADYSSAKTPHDARVIALGALGVRLDGQSEAYAQARMDLAVEALARTNPAALLRQPATQDAQRVDGHRQIGDRANEAYVKMARRESAQKGS